MDRRGFLKVLGIGTASAPLAAKAAFDAEISTVTGLGPVGAVGLGQYIPFESSGQPGAASNMTWAQQVTGVSEYIKIFGLPEVIEKSIRKESKYINSLDPDIACKKSWSMCVKIQHQRERNFQNKIKQIKNAGSFYQKKSVVEKLMGFQWPW